jgi:3-methyladenine DNA glycosylase AlkD
MDYRKGTWRMDLQAALAQLHALGNPANVEGMARFGIRARKALGVPTPELRRLARQIGKDHRLARQLWATEILDARALASLIDDPGQVTEKQMERWVKQFDSWAICDACCSNLFDKTAFAYRKVVEWSARKEEFVKRAGFVLMAALAVHDKKTGDQDFIQFLPIVEREVTDERNFVRKAVNWALRQIGKRNWALNRRAIQTAQTVRSLNSRSARWIAADALRELTSKAVQQRLRRGDLTR